MNSMVATVENHFHDQENLPAITVSICQANDDFTIKISDQGGGMDRDFAAKSFLYQYRTKPRYSNIHHLKDGSGLPLARLYARYFQGDIKMASYEVRSYKPASVESFSSFIFRVMEQMSIST